MKRLRARPGEGSVCERIGQEKGGGRGCHTYEGVDSGNESVTTALWKRYQQKACQSDRGPRLRRRSATRVRVSGWVEQHTDCSLDTIFRSDAVLACRSFSRGAPQPIRRA
jgi:hypothetical protein